MARVRSPNYPQISLKDAIERIGKVHAKEQTLKAAPEVIAKALGYQGLNGKSLGVLSALKKYGLLDEIGKDLKVSADALTILLDPKSSVERAKAIQKAAFAPTLFAELRKEYGPLVPSDENMRSYLLKRGFGLNVVDAPIRAYRETMALVKEANELYTAHKTGEDNAPPKLDDDEEVEVGDLVQWESGAVLQFDKPRRVRAIQDHDGARFAFVDGSDTGIPMTEIQLEQKGQKPPITPPILPLDPSGGSVKLTAEEREWQRGALSRDVSYRLIVKGDISAKEVGKLITILQAQKAVLADDDEEEVK